MHIFIRKTHFLKRTILTKIMCNYFESCKRLNTFTWNMKEAYLFCECSKPPGKRDLQIYISCELLLHFSTVLLKYKSMIFLAIIENTVGIIQAADI